MSSALNSDFFSKEVILYTASGVVWKGGRQVKSYPWKQVLSLAEQLGLDIRRTGGSVVGEIRIKQLAEVEPIVVEEDAPVEKAPAESMNAVDKALFVSGCNILERFLDRETADMARYTQTLEEVGNWVMRLTDLSEANQATLNAADAWLDKLCPSVEPEPVAAPSRVKFGCEHCGFMGVCDCADELDDMFEWQMLLDGEAVDQYLVAEDDGPRVDVGDCTPQLEANAEIVEMCHIANTAAYITWDPRSNDIMVDGQLQPGTMSWLAEILRDAGGWRWVSRGDYELNRWVHDERFAAQASAAAEVDPEPVVIEEARTENAKVVILTPHGMFEPNKGNLHVKSYPEGWHLGRAWTWLQSKGWHVVERDMYRGQLRHATFAKV